MLRFVYSWRPDAGYLIVTQIITGPSPFSSFYPYANPLGVNGVRVAEVEEDIKVRNY